MHAHCDHDEVRDAQDRSWTLPLIDIIRDPATADDEREDAFDTLGWLEDYRAIEPLTAILEDRSLPDDWRDSAAYALRSIDDHSKSERVRAWWADGDEPLRRHALLCMWRDEADLVIPVASDPNHPLQVTALNAMTHGFDEGQYVPIVLRALEHPDPDVRQIAAEILMWNEPVVAELPLLRASHDPEPDVACEALRALEYFPTRRAFRALSQLVEGAEDPGVREYAETALDGVRTTFEIVAYRALAHGDGGASMRAWMEPVSDLMTWPEAQDSPEAAEPVAPEYRPPIAEDELREMLDDANGRWRDKQARFRNIDWDAFGDAARERLAAFFMRHPDPDVRAAGTVPLAAWQRAGDLAELLGDPAQSVRKPAGYRLVEVQPSPAVVEPLWSLVMTDDGFTAREALASYARHAPVDDAIARIEPLVRDDPRLDIQYGAISELETLGASDAIDRLTDLLAEPPGGSWSVHRRLIDARRTVGLPCPDLSSLEFVDDVHLMAAVLEFQAIPN